MRIYSAHLYLVPEHPGISGFQQWYVTEHRLMRGDTVRARGVKHLAQQFCPIKHRRSQFRLENGKLPDCQPIITADAAAEVLQNTPGMTAVLLKGGG